MRYLIVEDEPRVAAFVAQALRDEGHSAEIVADGRSAVDRIAAQPFDAILLDRMLPGCSGLEVASRVRSLGVTTPILLMSARDSAEDVAEGLAAGADDYLPKPFRLAELLRRLDLLTTASDIQ